MTEPIVFLDTETTSLAPDRQAWDIAIIRRDDEHGERATAFFVDVDLAAADEFALRIGGFWARHPRGRWLSGRLAIEPTPYCDDLGWSAAAPAETTWRGSKEQFVTPRVAAERVARWTHGAHVVGINPGFDTDTLDPLLRARRLAPAWNYHPKCVKTLAVGYLAGLAHGLPGGPDWDLLTPPWSTEQLAKACGVELPGEGERHTALGDARLAMRWWDTITGGPR